MSVLEVDGAAGFGASMTAAAGDLAGALAGAHRDAVRLLAETADRRVPRRTGRLARSRTITVDASATAGGSAVLGYTAPYASVINFGWPARHIAATAFLTGALVDQRAALEQLYTDTVTGIVAGIHD